jgi:glycosyltransferase involved in cell wall biosynthesis
LHGFSEQAVEAKRRHGCNVVYTVWENIPYFCENSHYPHTWRERMKHPNAPEIKAQVRDGVDLFLPVTRQAAEALRIGEVNDERIERFPIGVDTERFRPGRLTHSYRSVESFGMAGGSAINVVFVGRYTYSKGGSDLLSAWKCVVREAERPVHLTLISGGDGRDQAEQFSSHAGVSSVSIRGPVPYDEVPLVFDGAVVAVVPSLPAKQW